MTEHAIHPPSPAVPRRPTLARSAGLISLGTAASRVLGFVRDFVIAHAFGTGIQAQAFVVAFRLPNLLRDLVAEGAMTSAIVPVLSTYRATRSREAFRQLVQALATRILAAVSVMALLGVWLAPWCVRLIAPGFADDPEKLALTIRMTRWLFPFIVLVGLWAYVCGVLNTLNHFALPALGPAVLNLITIVGCLWWARRIEPPVLGLTLAVLVGGAAQLLMVLPKARALGVHWRLRWSHPGAGQVLALLGPRLVGAAVHQISVVLNTMLASFGALAGDGAVAALYFANRLVQLPLALFASASAQASLPALSEQAALKDFDGFRSTLSAVLRVVLFESLPAAVGLVVLARPIVEVCFERGAFDHRSTLMTAQSVRYFAVGLIFYAAAKVLTGAFYALQDTRTPVRLAAEALAVNAALAIALLAPLQVGGLALATAVASALNAWRLLRKLERRLGVPLGPALAGSLWRIALASTVMGVACWWGWTALGKAAPRAAVLCLVIVSGMLIYAAGCAFLGVQELTKVLRWATRRLQPSS